MRIIVLDIVQRIRVDNPRLKNVSTGTVVSYSDHPCFTVATILLIVTLVLQPWFQGLCAIEHGFLEANPPLPSRLSRLVSTLTTLDKRVVAIVPLPWFTNEHFPTAPRITFVQDIYDGLRHGLTRYGDVTLTIGNGRMLHGPDMQTRDVAYVDKAGRSQWWAQLLRFSREIAPHRLHSRIEPCWRGREGNKRAIDEAWVDSRDCECWLYLISMVERKSANLKDNNQPCSLQPTSIQPSQMPFCWQHTTRISARPFPSVQPHLPPSCSSRAL